MKHMEVNICSCLALQATVCYITFHPRIFSGRLKLGPPACQKCALPRSPGPSPPNNHFLPRFVPVCLFVVAAKELWASHTLWRCFACMKRSRDIAGGLCPQVLSDSFATQGMGERLPQRLPHSKSGWKGGLHKNCLAPEPFPICLMF